MSERSATIESDKELIAANIRAYRARRNLKMEEVAAGMREFGHTSWVRQTVASVEQGRRRVTADEILGLARVLNTFPVHLISEPRVP
jgi:transcriptional regulator with XRE-family HTH domain